MMWEPTLLSRLGWGFKLFGRTMLVQTVAGLLVIVLFTLAGLLASLSPAASVFVSVILSLLLTAWLYQVLIVSFARSMAENGMPPLVPCLQDGLARLPVMGNAMLLLMLLSIPLMIVIALLGMLHPLASLLGTLVFLWLALRTFTLICVVTMEEVGPWEALKLAWRRSAGFELRMLGNALFLALLFVLFSALLSGLFMLIGLSGMVQQLALQVQAGGVADPAMLLMSLDVSALIAMGGFVLGALLLELLMLAFIMAYSFFFYIEQKTEHDGSKPEWQSAGMAERKQWVIYLSLVGLLAILPTVAVALAPPAPTNSVKAPQSTSNVHQKTVAAQAKSAPAAKKTLPTVNNAAAGADVETTIPESQAHRVKAPVVDVASLRDPFESYLTVLERQSRDRLDVRREQDNARVKEPLESFDLATLRLVAIMKMGDTRAAMVEDVEGKGYVVRKGSYIGRDSGRVSEITARDVLIIEEEFNPAGELVKRKASLTLNEVNE